MTKSFHPKICSVTLYHLVKLPCLHSPCTAMVKLEESTPSQRGWCLAWQLFAFRAADCHGRVSSFSVADFQILHGWFSGRISAILTADFLPLDFHGWFSCWFFCSRFPTSPVFSCGEHEVCGVRHPHTRGPLRSTHKTSTFTLSTYFVGWKKVLEKVLGVWFG